MTGLDNQQLLADACREEIHFVIGEVWTMKYGNALVSGSLRNPELNESAEVLQETIKLKPKEATEQQNIRSVAFYYANKTNDTDWVWFAK